MIKQKILYFLSKAYDNNPEAFYTATDIARKIEERIDSTSSHLKKLYDKNLVLRKENIGPCNGYGYKHITELEKTQQKLSESIEFSQRNSE